MSVQCVRDGRNCVAKADRVFTRQDVGDLIADGGVIIILDNHVLRLNNWITHHPGGEKAILHMVGRDATDEVNVLHSDHTRRQMSRYRIGRIDGSWRNFQPPIQGGRFCHRTEVTDGLPEDNQEKLNANILETPERDHLMSAEAEHQAGAVDCNGVMATFIDMQTRKAIRLDVDKYPPMNTASQRKVAEKYRLLHERIQAEGLYKCNYTAYAYDAGRITFIFLLMLLTLRYEWYILSGVVMGCFWHQLVFIAHDSGHMAITHNYTIDTLIAILVGDFVGGLSIGWWKLSHNIHHVVTNAPEHDPDIEHFPFLAVSHRFFSSLTSTYYNRVMEYDAAARFLVRFQEYLYYPLLSLGRFYLYILSWEYLLRRMGPKKPSWHWWLELLGQCFFWTWFGYGILGCCIPTWFDRLKFILVSHMVTMPLHVQFTLSHFAMSTADLGPEESFAQKMLRTTMDVDCPTWLDFLHGGLQFQAVHHLFPRVPRHNLRQTQKLVLEFCIDAGIPYALYGFIDCNKKVIGKLSEISRQAAILTECQRSHTLLSHKLK